MATLLMRTPGVDGAENLAIGNVERARLHNEKASGHGEHEGPFKTSAEGRNRTRKGKSGQKKQPQRGLGVAQLEKLRLQEQSKQEAACLASLQSLPSFGFTGQNQNGGMFFRHIKDAISHYNNNGRGRALPFGNGRFGSSDKLAEYLARDGHRHVGKGTADGDVLRTLMSLSSIDHSKSVSLSRLERAPSVSITLPRRKDDFERAFVCNTPQADVLGNEVLGSPSSFNNRGTEVSPARRAPCALPFVASPSKSVRKSSFFSSAVVSRVSPTDSHVSSEEIVNEKRTSVEVDTPKDSVLHESPPVSNNGVVEVGVINAKLLPVIVKTGEGAPIFTLTNLQCFESPLGPVDAGRLPRDRTNVPVVVGAEANCHRPKEQPSVQSFSSNQSWSTLEKSSGWKRPWQSLHESKCKLMQHSDSLDLNALADEIDVAHKDRGSTREQNAVGAHHSVDIIRTVSEDCSPRPLKIQACGTWDANRSLKAGPDVGLYSDESFLKGRCTPESKSSCQSVFPPSSLTLNRRRCLSSPELPLMAGLDHQKSGDFLTLGLSSYPSSPSFEVEVNSQEAMIPEGVLKMKQAHLSSKEAHNVLQLQMCNPQQVQMASCSSFGSNELISGEVPAINARKFSSLSSGSLTEHCYKQSGRKESLDLRLKLAL